VFLVLLFVFPWKRPYHARVEQAARTAKEETETRIAEELRAAEAKQVMTKLQSDMSMLKERIPDERVQAQNTAKDIKYLRDRQMRLDLKFNA